HGGHAAVLRRRLAGTPAVALEIPMNSCCGRQHDEPILTVPTCFERGLVTRRRPTLPVAGARLTAADGLWAAFSLEIDNHRLVDIRFNAAFCTTLIAYCQALVDLGRGQSVDALQKLETGTLSRSLPGVPAARQD